ncbi:MAG: polysaccharide deacetylase family protein [Anaerolineales bacterium]|nr:polysaccharide deacetylase family protein [Anaerolineales bacterium]
MISLLMYHQVSNIPEASDPLGLAISPKKFDQQMAFLYKANYKCLTLNEAVFQWRNGLKNQNKAFVLTFDDGYQDIIINALPIMKKYGFSATIFLVAGKVSNSSDWRKSTPASFTKILTWEETQILIKNGFTIGSHTLNHPRLTLLDEQQARAEIRGSKELMEDNLGQTIDVFSYPYGDSNPQIQKIVAESGFSSACGVDRGKWGFYNLWRVECARKDSLLKFFSKVNGLYLPFYRFREESSLGVKLRAFSRRRLIYKK